MRIPDGRLPILMATLGTFPNPASVATLRGSSVEMYETPRLATTRPKYFTNIARTTTRKIPHGRGRSYPSRRRCWPSISDEIVKSREIEKQTGESRIRKTRSSREFQRRTEWGATTPGVHTMWRPKCLRGRLPSSVSAGSRSGISDEPRKEINGRDAFGERRGRFTGRKTRRKVGADRNENGHSQRGYAGRSTGGK